MTDGYQVVTGALRKEATKWDEYATAVEPVHAAVQNATLDVSAFFIGDPTLLTMTIPQFDAKVHQLCYQSYVTYLEKLLAGAKSEFPQVADALIRNATAYEHAEKIIELPNLEELWTE
jgi:hypothetical protein